MQCQETMSWQVLNGVIRPIVSERNRPNQFGIKHRFGKRKGKLKKNKLITTEEMEKLLAET